AASIWGSGVSPRSPTYLYLRRYDMPTLQEQIEESRREALAALEQVGNSEALEEWNIKYLGKKGQLTGLFRGVGALPPDERARAGQADNTAKQELEEAYTRARERAVEPDRRQHLQKT